MQAKNKSSTNTKRLNSTFEQSLFFAKSCKQARGRRKKLCNQHGAGTLIGKNFRQQGVASGAINDVGTVNTAF